ncbi:carbamoyltransferase HypF [Geobacter sp. SVR]|uniref:carbamoyltransferase HypF n=1 Tax=Geobacter sp. SVR TaxID=2495594 RepID=UPI001563BCA1|nr:carbamoyltransferase HypF [Geobacter sp. SVR]
MAGRPDSGVVTRRRFAIGGIVQGVGFRPFVYRLARDLSLTGWVRNTTAGVELEVQGKDAALAAFERSLREETPPLAVIASLAAEEVAPCEETGFRILGSAGGASTIQVAPDSNLCSDCLRELFDPADRRYRYPFITCTNCGPRYSIITGIPYDRPKTTMAGFPMCPACLEEYHDPDNRRFHAQPVACPACGPQVRLQGSPHASASQPGQSGRGENAVGSAVELLENGLILAIKGIGGYHLAVNACDHSAVQRLRERKKRDEKPFAVMAADLAAAQRLALLNETERRLLTAPESPIVIARKTRDCPVSPLVAPNNGWLGLMLPYTPLHHLLMRGNFEALVMTSANVSDEPIAFEDDDALERLGGIADCFLVHDRPIHIRSDDSVIRVFQGSPLFYRRARGYAPRTVRLPFETPPLLGVGAELKNAICLSNGREAFLSQHIGDLQNSSTYDSFRRIIGHLAGLLEITPRAIACDQHPDYLSSLYATESGLPVTAVQHHHAHMAACMAENGLKGEAIGVVFDGTGYGSDGTIWGGEFLVGGYDGFRRAGHFRTVPLPGGDAAVREPWRMAAAYLHQIMGTDAFALDLPAIARQGELEKEMLAAMLEKGINSPPSSSCGRLFDAVAALLGLRHTVSYDGQAAIELEALAEAAEDDGVYPYRIGEAPSGSSAGAVIASGIELDFSPMFLKILSDLADTVPAAVIARRFHGTVAHAGTETCLRIAASTGLERIVLSGGVFQNRILSDLMYSGLVARGMQVYTHRLVPPNDGGIALGQVAIAGRRN